MNLELKEKAYQLLIDKIDTKTFQIFLHELVEKGGKLKSNSFVFNTVNIDYRNLQYKITLLNLLKGNCKEIQLTSIKIYCLCLKIIDLTNEEEIFNSLKDLIHISYRIEDEGRSASVLFEIVGLNYHLFDLREYKSHVKNIEEKKNKIKEEAKIYAKKIIEKYIDYRENEDWDAFLSSSIIGEKVQENEEELEIISNNNVERRNIEKPKSFWQRIAEYISK